MENLEKIVVLAIPVYFGTLFLEAFLSVRLKKNYYKLKDSLGNLGTGIMMQMSEVFTKAPLLAGYVYLYENYNLTRSWNLWDHGIISWIAAFLLVDCVYYFFHRHSHEVNLLWAAHTVHHSSEEYNFSVALRQSTLQGYFHMIYMVFYAFIGMPPVMVMACYGINLVYQFFIHTRFVPKLGPLEWVLNTPSHHRVHHARQGKYLDCNYAGVFIIWDRLFGTFTEEQEEPRYGVYPRFQSYDPVRANVMPMVELYRYVRLARGTDKLRVLFSGPLWLYEKFKKGKNLNVMAGPAPADAQTYVLFSVALAFALVVLFVPTLSVVLKALAVGMVFLFLGLMGRRLDQVRTQTPTVSINKLQS